MVIRVLEGRRDFGRHPAEPLKIVLSHEIRALGLWTETNKCNLLSMQGTVLFTVVSFQNVNSLV